MNAETKPTAWLSYIFSDDTITFLCYMYRPTMSSWRDILPHPSERFFVVVNDGRTKLVDVLKLVQLIKQNPAVWDVRIGEYKLILECNFVTVTSKQCWCAAAVVSMVFFQTLLHPLSTVTFPLMTYNGTWQSTTCNISHIIYVVAHHCFVFLMHVWRRPAIDKNAQSLTVWDAVSWQWWCSLAAVLTGCWPCGVTSAS